MLILGRDIDWASICEMSGSDLDLIYDHWWNDFESEYCVRDKCLKLLGEGS